MAVQDAAPAIDEAKVEAFMEKVMGDYSGAMMTMQCALGDRLGLFKKLAEGPATSVELAKRAGVNERYALEWLRGMAAAGYLEQDRSSGSYSLPPEHAPALAQEGGPMFFGGGYQMMPGDGRRPRPGDRAFPSGRRGRPGAVRAAILGRPGAVHERLVREHARFRSGSRRCRRLRRSSSRAAATPTSGPAPGCASIKLAEAFPNSKHVGYDCPKPRSSGRGRTSRTRAFATGCSFEMKDVATGAAREVRRDHDV